jgi:hypothetical protein
MTAPAACWCHGQHGITVPATRDGLCERCSDRSPSACQTAHRQEAAMASAAEPSGLLDAAEGLE